MKQTINIKLFGAVLLLAFSFVSSGYAFFPTFDTTEVVNTISTYTTQVQNVSASVQSALSVDKVKQAVGDAVGSVSKFTDLKKKQEKLQKKIEKQRRRAERLAKLRQKWENAYNNTKDKLEDVYEAGKEAYDETKDAVEDVYDAGKDLYEEGKDMYDEASDVYNQGSELANDIFGNNESDVSGSNLDNSENNGSYNTSSNGSNNNNTNNFGNTSSNNGNSYSGNYGNSNNTGSSANSKSYGNLDEGDEVTGAASVTNSSYQSYTDTGDSGSNNGPNRAPAAGTQPAPNGELSSQSSAAVAETDNAKAAVSEKTPIPLSNEVANSSTNNVNRRPFSKQMNSAVPQVSTDSSAEKSVTGSVVKTINDGQSASGISAAVSPTAQSVKSGADTADKYSFSYVIKKSLAYAQLQSTFKTGTNNDGKFIYSDIIANKCGMNFDEISEEKVAECVKTWVLGMHDPNAETATEWKNLYKNALHDHVASDVNKALEQKNYSANFDTQIADDLENKADALTNEREEVSFSGQVNQVNQEIIIRLMEAQTSQVVTESLSAVNSLERDYYDEADDEE